MIYCLYSLNSLMRNGCLNVHKSIFLRDRKALDYLPHLLADGNVPKPIFPLPKSGFDKQLKGLLAVPPPQKEREGE